MKHRTKKPYPTDLLAAVGAARLQLGCAGLRLALWRLANRGEGDAFFARELIEIACVDLDVGIGNYFSAIRVASVLAKGGSK